MAVELKEEELKRYSRHLLLPGFGREGQIRLGRASVLVAGTGIQGGAAALYLAAAGVGRLGIWEPETADDPDVDPAARADLGWGTLLKERLQALNPAVRVDVCPGGVDERTVPCLREWLLPYDMIAGCVRSPRVRYRLVQLAVEMGKTLVQAAVWGWEGQMATTVPGRGPCWHCLVPFARDRERAGAASRLEGPVAGAMGILQATELIKMTVGIGQPPVGSSVYFDGYTGRFQLIGFTADPACPICSGQKGE